MFFYFFSAQLSLVIELLPYIEISVNLRRINFRVWVSKSDKMKTD